MSVVYNWISEPQRGLPAGYNGPADYILDVTGRLEVTDISAPLFNEWRGGDDDFPVPATGRLVDLRIDPLNFDGHLHIYRDGDQERGGHGWRYSFDFELGVFTARSGGEPITTSLRADSIYVLQDGYFECCDEAAVFGYWQLEQTVTEPAGILLVLMLLGFAVLKWGRDEA